VHEYIDKYGFSEKEPLPPEKRIDMFEFFLGDFGLPAYVVAYGNDMLQIKTGLTVKDIQRIFRCGRDKAYRVCHTAGFPKMTLYGTILIHPDELKKWMNRNRYGEIC